MDPKERIRIFNTIRDIPYRIPLSLEEIKENDSSCIGKSKLLYDRFSEFYPVRYRLYQFFWSQMDLPADIAEKINDDEGHHCVLEIKINSNWITLDPSWDEPLNSLLNINYWNGISDTAVSVYYTQKMSVKDSQKKFANEFTDSHKRLHDDIVNYEFYDELNTIFEQIRLTK